ncbi:MAG: class I tRNA ligase family protein [Chloroflexi bacterium]|nr:class I tRNA ligase family protein [Chloroflexota bacterium]
MPDRLMRALSAQPDLAAREHRILELWRSRATFARLRQRLRGGRTWSFLDGPITANNPMAVHHAWGRTYKDIFQRFHAMLGQDQRWQNGFDCQGLWVEVNVERELGFTSKRDIEAYGLADFVSLCKQRVLTYAASQTEDSIRLGMWMDWNDPQELLRLRDLLAQDPSQPVTVMGPDGPVTDSVEMMVGRLGTAALGGSYFTFSNENNDLIWGFLAECHRRGWLYKGRDSMPWCGRCGTGISQMEMNEGYQDREDPGLTVRLALRDRPGEWLLVWTTTPWTLPSNVAAAVGPRLSYVKVRQGDDLYWLARETVGQALRGPYEVLEERPGSDLVGWTYDAPYHALPAVREAFDEARVGEDSDDDGATYVHRVVPWDEVGQEEGTGIVHIAPGCGAEDFQLGKSLGLPVIVSLDEAGHFVAGFDWLTGRDAQVVTEAVVDDLSRRGAFYHLEPYRHRYPHCWRCGTPLLFRVVDEWFIDMGPLYDTPRDQLTAAQKDRSLRYQIMDVVDTIEWIPGFGHQRELDWLRSMQDWMISKKRYWGLALPIWECTACGSFDVISGRDELRQRAVAGWDAFEGHTPHRPYVDAVRIACSACGAETERIKDVGNPWLDAGIVPFSTLHYREDPAEWRRWFPADFITESFPGQFRNWFYSMLAMSTVLRREAPFRTILGYATLFAEDGRPMHKSWGNSIEFDEAAERIGVDVMRWMFARARPEDNILFGYAAADEARQDLLILWNVAAFLVTYTRLAGWSPRAGMAAEAAKLPPGASILDRWILSRSAGLAEGARQALADHDARAACAIVAVFVDDLSKWYLRRNRRRFSRNDDPADRAAASETLYTALLTAARVCAPILPFLAEELYQVLVAEIDGSATDSVHLTRWPDGEVAAYRDQALEAAMTTLRRAVELARALRARAGLRLRQPLAHMWLALPGGRSWEGLPAADERALLEVLAEELNIRSVELIEDGSDLVERRVKPLLPLIGKRLGAQVPAVLAAARAGDVQYLPDGGVRLAGVELAASEVEILASPRPGTAVAHDEGVVVVIDLTLTAELRAEGDARELTRAVQDLRKQAELALDARVDLWVDGEPEVVGPLRDHLSALAIDTLADDVHHSAPPEEVATVIVDLDAGAVRVGLRPNGSGVAAAP